MFTGLLAMATFFSCSNEEEDMVVEENNVSADKLYDIHSFNDGLKDCSYIDNNWGQNAYYDYTMVNQTQTNFLFNQNTKIASVFNISTVPTAFVHDNSGSTYNAISYGQGYILFGEDIYREALSKGRDSTSDDSSSRSRAPITI
ncbi:hypothetical protein N7U66_02825 [Lacinutrix neustonica]|uniref:Uncharacterized protein n=1 Tax=Lacinutrix neustonica TaxID=2980107 RepID=A0A9E8MWH6_9FLAO|nr:hypothetical protein [Lacinutrix neustonica]WAC02636.1 hypothetical protein N7U66_02825 [Lacinutrix neustonica]